MLFQQIKTESRSRDSTRKYDPRAAKQAFLQFNFLNKM